jgi:glycosyltransferase involved in cell wall biosynthesis
MRIVNVISSVDPRGGGPIEGVFSSCEVWFRHGHEPQILCLDPPDAPWLAQSRAPIFAVGPSGRWHTYLRPWFPWLRYGYTPRLSRWLKTHSKSYDVVVINGLWNYASYGSWRGLQGGDARYVVFTHGMLDPWFNRAYPIKTFFKTIFWKLFEHNVLRDARGVMFTCEEERRLARQSFSPYQANEFVVGYGSRDVEGDPTAQRAAFAARVPRVAGRKFILFLSRIHPKKGVDLLIEAFARQVPKFSDLDLVIAGPDQTGWKSELEKLARDLGVADRLHWPGMLSGDAKWGAFRSAEFFALPSHQENFGVVVAEAMSLSKPVLITKKVNIWREIEADGAGLVVDDDRGGVADGLERLCALPPAERQAMGERARRCFLDRYDIEKTAMRFLELAQRLSEEPRTEARANAITA